MFAHELWCISSEGVSRPAVLQPRLIVLPAPLASRRRLLTDLRVRGAGRRPLPRLVIVLHIQTAFMLSRSTHFSSLLSPLTSLSSLSRDLASDPRSASMRELLSLLLSCSSKLLARICARFAQWMRLMSECTRRDETRRDGDRRASVPLFARLLPPSVRVAAVAVAGAVADQCSRRRRRCRSRCQCRLTGALPAVSQVQTRDMFAKSCPTQAASSRF